MRDYLAKREITRGNPVVLQIEVTNRCTMKCPMCPRTHMNRRITDMDFDLFKQIIDQNKHCAEFAILHLMGEPLLHTQLPEMIGYCKKAGIRTVISTNATVLQTELDQKLIANGLDVIIFSVDGHDKNTYESIRQGGTLENVITNIKRFLNVKGRQSPYAVLQLINIPEVVSHIEEIREQWSEIPNIDLAIKPFTNWQGDIDRIGKIGGKESSPNLDSVICDRPWTWLTVLATGEVVPCCRDYNGTVILGDLNKNSTIDIWNGDAMKCFRRSHSSGRSKVPICARCDVNPVVAKSCAVRLAYRFLDQYTLYRLMYLFERL
ncbi:MAG: radical SAM protein [Oligoflexia bacterium]|nr:radical SAM protein [Oligoflexia bacterium]